MKKTMLMGALLASVVTTTFAADVTILPDANAPSELARVTEATVLSASRVAATDIYISGAIHQHMPVDAGHNLVSPNGMEHLTFYFNSTSPGNVELSISSPTGIPLHWEHAASDANAPHAHNPFPIQLHRGVGDGLVLSHPQGHSGLLEATSFRLFAHMHEPDAAPLSWTVSFNNLMSPADAAAPAEHPVESYVAIRSNGLTESPITGLSVSATGEFVAVAADGRNVPLPGLSVNMSTLPQLLASLPSSLPTAADVSFDRSTDENGAQTATLTVSTTAAAE